MNKESKARYVVAVIGAGPAGLFASRELASRGVRTILFNRDIKPGGLAEYGIYPSKTRMKEGLRNQFHQILDLEEIQYYGNVLIGEHGDLSLADLRELGFQALLVTVGAQSTKRLGIPGEDLPGVYHAKDIVYHYNLLPPYSEIAFPVGKRVAVIGVGNVMMDVSRWLLEDQKVDEVIAIARRGPMEVKFDRKELESMIGYVNMPALDNELERVALWMREVNQDPAEFMKMMREAEKKAEPHERGCCFLMRFLSSPIEVLDDGYGHIGGLKVEENKLVVGSNGETRAKGTGQYSVLDVDTVIFAIGDVVDSAIGLPVQWGEFASHPQPRFPIQGLSFEAYDLETGQPFHDIFLAGWARQPSTGLVGVARKDGTYAAEVVSQYLQTLALTTEPVEERVRQRLERLEHPYVDKQDLLRLKEIERERARELNLPSFKYASNHEMLEALGLVSSKES